MQLDAIQWEFDLEAFEELHLGHSMGGVSSFLTHWARLITLEVRCTAEKQLAQFFQSKKSN